MEGENISKPPTTLRIRDLTDNNRVVSSITGPFWGDAAPLFVDSHKFFVRVWNDVEEDILLCSLDDGESIGGLKAPGGMGTQQRGPAGLAYHSPSRRLFVSTCVPMRQAFATRSPRPGLRGFVTTLEMAACPMIGSPFRPTVGG